MKWSLLSQPGIQLLVIIMTKMLTDSFVAICMAPPFRPAHRKWTLTFSLSEKQQTCWNQDMKGS